MKFSYAHVNGHQFDSIKSNVHFLVIYLLFFFPTLNFVTPLVLCKFGVADALLHSLSCGNSLVFISLC